MDCLEEKTTTKHQPKLIVGGSSQFTLNQYINEGVNRDLFLNLIEYLNGEEDFIAIRPKEDQSGQLSIGATSQILSLTASCFILPLRFY